jgi:hypothetical protein
MQASVLAGWLLALAVAAVMAVPAMRLAAGGKGAHAAPRRYVIDLEEATIPRAPTEHGPPWGDTYAFAPAPVIEPAAVTHGPPQPEPEADAYWIAAGTYNRETGQARTVRVELLPPVAELLGHASTGDAVESMCAEWHSVASIFNGAHVGQVRALLAGES